MVPDRVPLEVGIVKMKLLQFEEDGALEGTIE